MKIIQILLTAIIVLQCNSTWAITESEKSQATGGVQKALASSQIRPEQVSPTAKASITGLEWLKMSEKDQMDYILSSMLILTKHGVVFARTPNDYYKMVKDRLRFNPDFYLANVTNILASIVYEREPENREALDQIRKKPEIKKIEMH